MKIIKCKYCNKEVEVDKHYAHQYICEECKCEHKIGRQRKCSICGGVVMYKSGGCKNEFCKKHPLQQLKTLIKYFGFNQSVLGTPAVETEFYRIKDILYKDYWINNLTSSDICKKYNYPNTGNLTAKVFEYLNIPVKSNHTTTKESWLNGKHIDFTPSWFKQEWHTTWNNKEVYLRSSYEIDFAKELDKNNVDYDVECLRIKYFDTQKNEYRCAIPDFYLPETNTIVEIKSDYTYNQQNMKDKFTAYKNLGYNCKLILNHKEVKI